MQICSKVSAGMFAGHMFFGLNLVLIFACSISPKSLSAQDTISRLETRVENLLMALKTDAKNYQLQLDSIQSLPGFPKDKDIKVFYNQLEEKYKVTLHKRNYLRELLGEIRQLKYRGEETAKKELKQIASNLNKLEKNKIPELKNKKILPSDEYARSATQVYEQPQYDFCRLTRSKDGKTLANEFEDLFEFTESKLDAYYKESDFLECKARFIKSEKDYFLELKFIFNSPQAEKLIGGIDAASPSRIDFLNGSFIYLQALAVTDAIKTAVSGQTHYHVQYKLDKEDLRNLSKYEVDTLTFVWTSGADKYEIVDLDVLKNMFACLKTKS